MPRQEKPLIIEYREHVLPAQFPLVVIAGDECHISDIRSDMLQFHNCMEIGLCFSGSGFIQFGREKFEFHAGDVTVISGDVPHTSWSSRGLSSEWSYLFFDPEEMLLPFSSADALSFLPPLDDILQGFYAVLSPRDYPRLSLYINNILYEMDKKPLNYEFAVRGLFLASFTEMMRIKTQQSGFKASETIAIAPALEYIHRHYMENFSIRKLAETCSMSQSHFRRIFHELMGISPLEYLNRVRITRACSMLRMASSSILTISIAVGFRSISSFNRHFLDIKGVTPSQWRKREGGIVLSP